MEERQKLHRLPGHSNHSEVIILLQMWGGSLEVFLFCFVFLLSILLCHPFSPPPICGLSLPHLHHFLTCIIWEAFLGWGGAVSGFPTHRFSAQPGCNHSASWLVWLTMNPDGAHEGGAGCISSKSAATANSWNIFIKQIEIKTRRQKKIFYRSRRGFSIFPP